MRELGSIISGEPAVIHHPIGATGKHNKQKIGHLWIIPLTDEEHKALHAGEKVWLRNEDFNIDAIQNRKDFEKHSFKFHVADQLETPDEYTYDSLQAIWNYHR